MFTLPHITTHKAQTKIYYHKLIRSNFNNSIYSSKLGISQIPTQNSNNEKLKISKTQRIDQIHMKSFVQKNRKKSISQVIKKQQYNSLSTKKKKNIPLINAFLSDHIQNIDDIQTNFLIIDIQPYIRAMFPKQFKSFLDYQFFKKIQPYIKYLFFPKKKILLKVPNITPSNIFQELQKCRIELLPHCMRKIFPSKNYRKQMFQLLLQEINQLNIYEQQIIRIWTLSQQIDDILKIELFSNILILGNRYQYFIQTFKRYKQINQQTKFFQNICQRFESKCYNTPFNLKKKMRMQKKKNVQVYKSKILKFPTKFKQKTEQQQLSFKQPWYNHIFLKLKQEINIQQSNFLIYLNQFVKLVREEKQMEQKEQQNLKQNHLNSTNSISQQECSNQKIKLSSVFILYRSFSKKNKIFLQRIFKSINPNQTFNIISLQTFIKLFQLISLKANIHFVINFLINFLDPQQTGQIRKDDLIKILTLSLSNNKQQDTFEQKEEACLFLGNVLWLWFMKNGYITIFHEHEVMILNKLREKVQDNITIYQYMLSLIFDKIDDQVLKNFSK